MTTTVATRDAINSVKTLLDKSKSAIASRLPKHVTADRLMKVALTAINKTPALLGCTQDSLLMSIMQAAELGLEPGGALGEGYLVPYGKTCQFIPGYRGLISLARRSGQIISLEAHVVHMEDAFTFELGLESKLVHVPNLEKDDAGPLRFVYAVAKLQGGGVQFEVMSRAQVEAIRKRSKAGSNGPWVSDYEEMARKTVVRRLFKYLPVSVELAQALELQAGAEMGDFTTIDITPDAEVKTAEAEAPNPSTNKRGSAALKDALKHGEDALKATVQGGAPAPASDPALERPGTEVPDGGDGGGEQDALPL